MVIESSALFYTEPEVSRSDLYVSEVENRTEKKEPDRRTSRAVAWRPCTLNLPLFGSRKAVLSH